MPYRDGESLLAQQRDAARVGLIRAAYYAAFSSEQSGQALHARSADADEVDAAILIKEGLHHCQCTKLS